MLKLVPPDAPDAAAHAPPDADAPVPRYWAFLSYSHHDKAIAKRLQKQLETYRVPRRLVGRTTSHGTVPPRLAPVFRDRDELHAGADLKASVQDALSRSRWLIVVCTPDAARSPWVNREIIEFKKLHGERRVLALIARGEPFASDKPGREAEECFPPALRRALNDQGLPEGEPLEPIAADMRREGDGPHRAMLKLLAGMLGVAFDDLVRRDVQRRLRWLTAIASSSVVGVVVFAFLAVMAVQARNEAQHQRHQAEGLIEFMLGDLRKKLEPVGRLEVLDAVGEKTLAYYGAQEASTLDANALGHRSRAMHLIGEIRDLRGQPAEAQKAFEQAAATTAQLLAQAPQDGKRVFDHAQSVFWVGDAAWKRGDLKTAEAKFEEYLQLARRLEAIDAKNPDWRAELAFAHVQLGMVRSEAGRPVEALGSLALANDLLGGLLAQRPNLRFELTQSLAWAADAHELLGDYPRALEEQQQRLALFRQMPGADKDRTVQRNIVNALDFVSTYELALGNVASARENSLAAVRIADELVLADPKNLYWLGDACIARLRLAEIELAAGNAAGASAAVAATAPCVAQTTGTASLGPSFAIKLTSRYLVMSMALGAEAQRAALMKDARGFLDRTVPTLKAGMPNRAKLAVELANAAIALGDQQSARDPQAARASWQQADDLLEPHRAMRNAAVLTPMARALHRLGDNAGAQALVARIQSSSYRHPAFVGLVKQLHAAQGGSRTSVTTLEKT